MTMETLYLGFVDEAEAQVVLGIYRAEGDWQQASHEHALDPVGTLYDEEGEPIAGFHVNLQLAAYDGVALESYRVRPVKPQRVWL